MGNFRVREVFQSYGSIIAVATYWPAGTKSPEFQIEVVLDETYWDWSNTTRKYLYQWLTENGHPYCNKASVLRKIEEGSIKLANLN